MVSYIYRNGCVVTYTEIHNVDVDLVEPSFTVDQSFICSDSGDILLTNTSQLDDASYTYLWTVTQSDSNTSYTDTASNPSFTLSDPGSWDVLLDITSSTECSIEPESVSGMVTVGGGIGFTTDFDGVLCNGQSITLENNSVQQSGFQWDIEGATIISDPSAQDNNLCIW